MNESKMNEYKKYSNDGITALKMTNTWLGCLDTTYTDKEKENDNEDRSYVLHATGHCDMMNGRRYIALPANLNVNDPAVKLKYNLI